MPRFEDNNAPEHIPTPAPPAILTPAPPAIPTVAPAVDIRTRLGIKQNSEVVDAFRIEINAIFVRFQGFYDRTNAAMRNYRLAHVDLVTNVYNQMMTVFGDQIDVLRSASSGLKEVLAQKQAAAGVENSCLDEIHSELDDNIAKANLGVQLCAEYANSTMSRLLTNAFYPTFQDIQTQISTVPNAVIDVLSRGNVLQDEEAILEFLRARYTILERQWYTAVSQLLRWESNRFEVDGLFMVDEQTICMSGTTLDLINKNAALEVRASAC